jgi:hypothetical protein
MHAADFTVTHSCAAAIQPGLNDYAEIRFSPSAEGVRTATLTIASSDPNTPSLGVQLSGSGASTARPHISLSTSSLDFGATPAGTSITRLLVISNTGTAPLTLLSQMTSGAPFTVETAAGSPIPAGGNATTRLVYSPSAAGTHNGTFSVACDDPASPIASVALHGTCNPVTGPRITLSRTIVDFGQVALYASKEEEIGIRNSGTADLVISSQEIAGTDALHFSIVQAAGSPVAPGGNTTVRVRHLPTTSGSKVAMLRLTTNDAGQPVSDVMLVSVVVSVASTPARPGDTELSQNHPNPFSGSTVIEYTLTLPGRVEMTAYNVLGQRVSIIETAWRDAGAHRIVCDAAGMPSGVYVVELRHADAAGGFRVQRIRMLLTR